MSDDLKHVSDDLKLICQANGCLADPVPSTDACVAHLCTYIDCTKVRTHDRRCAEHQNTMVRLDMGKQQWELLSIAAISELVNVCTYGAKKYPAESWRQGYKYRATWGAAIRHAAKWMCGEMRDPESGCHHLAHAMWNFMVIVEWDFLPKKKEVLDDRAVEVAPIQDTSNIKQPDKKVK